MIYHVQEACHQHVSTYAMYVGKVKQALIVFQPVFLRFVVVICHVQKACHHHFFTYIMCVGTVGGPHRIFFLLRSFVVSCFV